MPDDNTLITRVGFEPDTASIQKTKAAVETVEKDISGIGKAIENAARSKALDDLPKRLAKVAVETGDTEKAVTELSKELGKVGASEKEVDKVTAAFLRAKEAAEDAAKEANSYEGRKARIQEGGADFSGDVASASSGLRGAIDAIGGESAGAITGILDATTAIADLGEQAPLMANQVASAATALGPVGVGVAIAVGAITAAFVAASQSIQEEAGKIASEAEARLSFTEQAARGKLSASDVQSEIDENNRVLEDLYSDLADAQTKYNSFLAEQPDVIGNAGDNLLRVFDAREDAYAAAADNIQKRIQEIESDNKVRQEAIDEGRLSADSAASSEANLTAERQKAAGATSTAASAEQDAQRAQQKAQQERERAAEKERAAAEKAQQDAQRAAEQRQKELQSAQDGISKSNTKFADTLTDLGTKFAESIEDIQRKADDTESDSRKKFGRDVSSLSLKAQDEEKKARVKSYQELEKIEKDYRKNLSDIAKQANDDEESARAGRNFLQLAEARKAQQKALDAAKEDAQSAVQERVNQDKVEADERLENLKIARRDRKIAFDQELADNRENEKRALRDAEINNDRQLEQAQIAHEREQKELQKHLNELLSVRQGFYSAEMNAASGASSAGSGINSGGSPFSTLGAAGGASKGGLSGSAGFGSGISPAPFKGSAGGITNNYNYNNSTSNTTSTRGNVTVNTAANPRDVLKVLKQAGYA